MTPEQFTELINKAVEAASGKSGTAMVDAFKEHITKAFPIPSASSPAGFKSVGQQLVANEAFREWVKIGNSTGKMGNFGPLSLEHPMYSLKEGDRIEPLLRGFHIEMKDVTASQFPAPRTVLPFVQLPTRRFRVRDLMPVEAIGTPRVDYAEVSGFSNNAQTQIGEGALKGQSEITTTERSESAETIATFMAVGRRALSDVPQIRAFLDATMENFLSYEEDDQILNGTGVNALRGILQVSGLQNQSKGTDTNLDAIRKAVTKVQTALGSGADTVGYEPTGLVLNPTDAEILDLAKDGNSRYLLLPEGGPPTESPVASGRKIWGLAVVVTPAIAAGTGLVGAFDIGSTLLIYEGLSMRASDSHDDFFRRNKVALLAEYRAMHPIYSPKAYCKVSGIA